MILQKIIIKMWFLVKSIFYYLCICKYILYIKKKISPIIIKYSISVYIMTFFDSVKKKWGIVLNNKLN